MKKNSLLYNLGLITILLVSLQVYYLYASVIPAIEEKNSEITEKKVLLAKERARFDELEKLNQNRSQLLQYVQSALNALPREDNKTSIPYHIYSVADKSQAQVFSLQIKGTTRDQATGVNNIIATAKIGGRYQNVMQFITTLYQTNRITTTDTVSLKGLGDEFVEMTINIHFYFQAEK